MPENRDVTCPCVKARCSYFYFYFFLQVQLELKQQSQKKPSDSLARMFFSDKAEAAINEQINVEVRN